MTFSLEFLAQKFNYSLCTSRYPFLQLTSSSLPVFWWRTPSHFIITLLGRSVMIVSTSCTHWMMYTSKLNILWTLWVEHVWSSLHNVYTLYQNLLHGFYNAFSHMFKPMNSWIVRLELCWFMLTDQDIACICILLRNEQSHCHTRV